MDRNLDWYIETAKIRSGASSDRKICEMLGMAENAVHAWKKKRVLPSDETMMKLAAIAGVDPWTALLDLNMWRSQGAAQDVYRSILEKIKASIVIMALLGALSASPASAESKQYTLHYAKDTVYYGK